MIREITRDEAEMLINMGAPVYYCRLNPYAGDSWVESDGCDHAEASDSEGWCLAPLEHRVNMHQKMRYYLWVTE